MIGLKLIERSIGLVSTVILARLLMPADFGLVAMAMAVFAILELAGQFGFDHALIRDQNASRAHYDTAWTLTACHGMLSGLVLAASAHGIADFFKDPRLVMIIYALAVIAVIQGFENIGIMLFRKEMRFGMDFRFQLAKKLIAFAFTVALALTFKSYWALVGGILASRGAGAVLSYVVHPYRPRFCLSEARELFRFSKWILLNGLVGYLSARGPDYLIGRFANATSLGLFRVSSELSNLPTTELMYPIARAAYPGYAKVAADRTALKNMFLTVQGAVIIMALPAGVGIVMLADPFVRLLLGPNWLNAVPLIQVLGVYGALRVFQTTNNSVFNVLGKPYWNTMLAVLETLVVLPLLGWLVYSGYGLEIAVWSYLAASVVVLPFAVALISRQLQLTFRERLRITWRPTLAAALMGAMLALAVRQLGPPIDAWSALKTLSMLVPAGILVYFGSVFALWWVAGKPSGTERRFLSLAADTIRGIRKP